MHKPSETWVVGANSEAERRAMGGQVRGFAIGLGRYVEALVELFDGRFRVPLARAYGPTRDYDISQRLDDYLTRCSTSD